tara:strand:- start:42 stop:320 length:279 start_codon:yes stop_codon:yes gene_type:complete
VSNEADVTSPPFGVLEVNESCQLMNLWMTGTGENNIQQACTVVSNHCARSTERLQRFSHGLCAKVRQPSSPPVFLKLFQERSFICKAASSLA